MKIKNYLPLGSLLNYLIEISNENKKIKEEIGEWSSQKKASFARKRILKFVGHLSYALSTLISASIFASYTLQYTSTAIKTQELNPSKQREKIIRNLANRVGYPDIYQIKDVYSTDINWDGITDIVIKLKDGNKLEYIGEQIYKLRKE